MWETQVRDLPPGTIMDNPNPTFEDPGNPYAAGFAPQPPVKTRGCFFYGCMIALVLLVIGLICMGVLAYLGYHYYTRMINEYTATAPVEIPKVDMPDDQRKALDERVAVFKTALDKGEAADLVLTSDEINVLISENEDFKGKVYITIKDDKVSGQLSFPLEKLGLPRTAGRYLNGSTTLTVKLLEGILFVFANELEVNGKTLPPEIKTQLATQNLAKDVANNPETAARIRKFESLVVKDGKVYVKSRSASEAGKSRSNDEEKEETKEEDKDADEKEPSEKADVKPSDVTPDESETEKAGDETKTKGDTPKVEEKPAEKTKEIDPEKKRDVDTQKVSPSATKSAA
ncbi:MAG: hypothetical protein NVSMB9_09760 [Isosphaeraceae bacterium]